MPYTLIFLPLNAPIFSSRDRSCPFIISLSGMLPWILAFDYEQTLFKKGKIAEKEAMGATLNDDLKDLPCGRETSIYVERLMIYGEMTGLGRDEMIVSCSYLIICWLFLTPFIPSITFFSSTSFSVEYSYNMYCLYLSSASWHISIILFITINVHVQSAPSADSLLTYPHWSSLSCRILY